MSELFINKNAMCDFYNSRMPEEVGCLFAELNSVLDDKLGGKFVELIPLGSVRGAWAVRKAIGINPYYNDIDCGVIINSMGRISATLDVVVETVNGQISQNGFRLCKHINPVELYFDISMMDSISSSSLLRAKSFLDTNDLWIFSSHLLPFLAKSTQPKLDFIEKLKQRYSQEEYAILARAFDKGVSRINNISLKHISEYPPLMVSPSEKPRLERLVNRINLLKKKTNEKKANY